MRSLICIALAFLSTETLSAQAGASWLDRPMTSWNPPASVVPAAQAGTESQGALQRRCGSNALSSSTTAEMLRTAGWVPFLHFDSAIARDGVEVIGGMTTAGPGCEPTIFNLFVFVDGRFAGTISPAVMTQSRDGVAGAVRLTAPDSLTAEFARYTPNDTECCPSSRVRVTYRIEHTGSQAALVPLDTRTLR